MKQQIKDESKEVKEGGELFTGGEWGCSPVLNFSDTLVSYIKSDFGKDIAQLRGCTTGEEKEAKANAALIAQSKNMYYLLQNVFNEYTKTGSVSANCIAEWLSIHYKVNKK